MLVLGVSGWDHDASVALLDSGVAVAIGEEERFTRARYQGHPHTRSLDFCLRQAKVRLEDVDMVTYYMLQDTVDSFKSTYLHRFVGNKPDAFVCVDHHATHAACAFFTSPFTDAAILTIDGYGDGTSAAIWHGHDTSLTCLERIPHPHTLGGLWMGLTQYLGFGERDEGKTMALASYGEPKYLDLIMDRVQLREDGGYRFDLGRYDTLTFLDGRHTFFLSISPPRPPGEPLRQVHFDIADSLQEATNIIVLRMVEAAFKMTGSPNLCLAGGVALNSVLNGVIRRRSPFEQVYVPPFPGDNGAALGSALYYYHHVCKMPRTANLSTAALGEGFNEPQIRTALERIGSSYSRSSLRDAILSQPPRCDEPGVPEQAAVEQARLVHYRSEEVAEDTADFLAAGHTIGWFQGRAEVGPRALGQRSILADPRRPEMRDYLNSKIKHREWFRPYGPAVIESECDTYFDSGQPSPFMAFVYNVRQEKRQALPAVTHVDGSARVQTVAADPDWPYYRLIRSFAQRTGVPVIVNTSFNDREPIVNTPEEALRCFVRTNLDVAVLGEYVVAKAEK
ncbi:MAG TPA: carbamoyltransferase C-terminal domain-containing protein [Chloroflexia bacterium]|nr:carbamoyltransferase C-terminal domain-containing protein [Chloroflexia bacterium]